MTKKLIYIPIEVSNLIECMPKDEEILIRAYGRNYFAKEIQNIAVRGNPDGTVIYLKDVADIKEQWEDVPDKTYFNGRKAVVLNLDQTEQEDILAIAEQAKRLVREFNEKNEQVQALVLDDQTIPLSQRLELLVKNGLLGLLLVVITLGFFLNLRLSFWVSIGIPFSFAGGSVESRNPLSAPSTGLTGIMTESTGQSLTA